MAGTFVLAAHRLRAGDPRRALRVPYGDPGDARPVRACAARAPAPDLPLTLLFGHSHEALAAADLALVASGTATLETALFKTPMVIAYRQSPLSWRLMRSMLYLPYVGLPNILAGEFLVPELLQDDATPEALAAALLAALARQAGARSASSQRFREFHELLRQNSARRKPLQRSWEYYRKEKWITCWLSAASTRPAAGRWPARCSRRPSSSTRSAGSTASPTRRCLRRSAARILAVRIKERAVAWSVAHATVEEIDRINILHASMLAMRRAVEALGVAPGEAWIDGTAFPGSVVR